MISILLFAALHYSSISTADEKPKATPSPVSTLGTQSLMHSFFAYLLNLKPFMTDEKKFSDPKNHKVISKNLNEMGDLSKTADHQAPLTSTQFKFSKDVLHEHMLETARVFKTGNKGYARWMLNSTLGVCMSCHTQLPSVSKSFLDLKSSQSFTSKFDRGEFLFATRDFDRAAETYTAIVKNYPKEHVTTPQLEVSLERLLAYYARIKRQPDVSIRKLQALSENKSLPQYMKDNLAAWIALMREWSKKPDPVVATATDDIVKNYAEKNLKPQLWDKMVKADNPRLVTHLRVSGFLYEYLNTHPNTQIMPEILYWLALCDRGTSNSFFYSLATMYLKECITQFPTHPIAKRCYREYEDETVASYSGSSGTNIPDDVQAELDHLKSLLPKSE